MRVENMFNFTNILGTAMQGTMVRLGALNNNIANVDTPGFNRSNVQFEDQLQRAVNNFRNTGRLDLSNVRARTSVEYSHLMHRLDENNVDIEFEMAQLYQTQMRYNVMSGSIMNHQRILQTVINMR
ncbi:MAG: flagellar basal body rod protein FlgB [Defluviitaleaceae bacterium]|nr:flagellar basal body rod protein FlgB [Defluviitaleaceae bacterium]